MKKSVIAITFACLTLGSSVNVAISGTKDPGVNKRQARQQARIADGVKSGELTREEAQALRAEQRAIREREHWFKADGNLTRTEREALRQDLRHSSDNIRREKRDSGTR